MEHGYMKYEARQQRYLARAKKARTWASVMMFLLTGSLVAAGWQSEVLGPQMKDYARTAIEKFEENTAPDSAAGTIVQAALTRLNL